MSHKHRFTRHVELYPAAPTPLQFDLYRNTLITRQVRLGLTYQTGPRRGQQLATGAPRLAVCTLQVWKHMPDKTPRCHA